GRVICILNKVLLAGGAGMLSWYAVGSGRDRGGVQGRDVPGARIGPLSRFLMPLPQPAMSLARLARRQLPQRRRRALPSLVPRRRQVLARLRDCAPPPPAGAAAGLCSGW